MNAACVIAEALTYGPFRLLAKGVCLARQFAVHLMETLDCIRYPIGHFEMVAESAVNREPRGCKLQTNGFSSPPSVLKQEILTLRAATKASPHEPPFIIDFAHSLKRDGEWRVVSALLSGVERHRCKKSVAKRQMHGGGTEQHILPATQVTMGSVI